MTAQPDPPLERVVELVTETDPALTMASLWQGPGDPLMRLAPTLVERALRLPSGAAALRIELHGRRMLARAWGPGAAEALAQVPALVGEDDDPAPLIAVHPRFAQLQRRVPGLRLTRGAPLMDTLLVSILGQKITSHEARRSYRALVRRLGEPAPGPLGLVLPPPPEKLATLPYWAYHEFGVERRRADTIRAAAAVADRLAVSLRDATTDERLRQLTTLPGIGPWTAAEAVRLAFGDPDAVSVGDFHLPRLVCQALAGEPDGDDTRMLELLEPFRGQRARAVLLIERTTRWAPRRAPRRPARSIESI